MIERAMRPESGSGSGSEPESGAAAGHDEFEAMIHLRWGDQDSLGHVNNVIYLRLLEESRIRFFNHLGYTGSGEFGMVTGRHEIDYLRPLFFSVEPISITCWLSRIGSSSFDMDSHIHDQSGEVVARARTVIIAIRPDGSASTPLPDAARAVLLPYLAPED